MKYKLMIKYFIYNKIYFNKIYIFERAFFLSTRNLDTSRYLFTFLEPRKSGSVIGRVISRSFRYKRECKDKLTCDIKRHCKKYGEKTRLAKMTMATEKISPTLGVGAET